MNVGPKESTPQEDQEMRPHLVHPNKPSYQLEEFQKVYHPKEKHNNTLPYFQTQLELHHKQIVVEVEVHFCTTLNLQKKNKKVGVLYNPVVGDM